jgi:hypothetical protein
MEYSFGSDLKSVVCGGFLFNPQFPMGFILEQTKKGRNKIIGVNCAVLRFVPITIDSMCSAPFIHYCSPAEL